MRFNRDRRGQSVVVGTVILFGFLILAISLYQVQIVPQENAQVEFEHFQEVRNDMVDLRAGILQAGSTDRRQYQTVQLGTTYPPRLFAINPPAPSGTIRTSDPYPITISNGTTTETVPTRFIQYRPGYHEIEDSSTWYDASVLYLDARGEGGEVAVLEDQNLVSDGKVQIVAVQNEFRRSGTGQVTLELYPAENVTETIPDGNLTVTVPTRLSDEYWSETDIRSDTYSITSDANDDDVYNLTLETTANDLTVDTVGVQEAPEEATQNDNGAVNGDSPPVDEGQSPSFSSIDIRDESNPPNPGGQQDRVVYDVEYTVNDPEGEFDRVDIEFQNYDSSGASETISSPTLADTVTHNPRRQDADFGDEYQITVRLFSTAGEVVDERVVVQDTADNTDP